MPITIGIAQSIREVQQNPIVFIADEFERYAKGAESTMKNFLDGKDSISNSLFIGATNYLEQIPDTLKDRPSRFRIVEEIKGIEDKALMKTILSDISARLSPNLFSSEEIDDIVKDINNCTLDELKHICLDRVTETFVPKKKKKIMGFLSTIEEENTETTYSWSLLIPESLNLEIKKIESNL